jgi:anaerobic C4-dicarboxylate transporter
VNVGRFTERVSVRCVRKIYTPKEQLRREREIMKGSEEMSGKECFLLFCLCIVAITVLVIFALHKGVDGVMFGSGMGAICGVCAWFAKTMIDRRKRQKGD